METASKITSQQVDDFLTFLRECEQQYHMAEAEEQGAGDITQDILHSLELEEHDYHEYAKLSKDLRDVRKRRRRAKDTMYVINPVLSWSEENRAVIKSLERLLGEIRKAERYT